MSNISDDNCCIFMLEYDDDARRMLGKDVAAEATLAYILLGKRIALHPAYYFQDSHTRSLIANDPKYFLEGEEVQIILGNSNSTIEYQCDRIEKLKQQSASLAYPSVELEQYNRFTDDQIKKGCELFDNHLVTRGSVHPIPFSRDANFRRLVREELELVRNIRYGSHLGALIINSGPHLHKGEMDRLLSIIIDLSNNTWRLFSCDSVIAVLTQWRFNAVNLAIINDRLHVLHWKAHEGHDLLVPLANRFEKKPPHPLDSDLFWFTLRMFIGEKIVTTFLAQPWKEQLRIARDLRCNPLWRSFTEQYISIVEMLAAYTDLDGNKVNTALKECRPTTWKAAWNAIDKWEFAQLSILFIAMGAGSVALLVDLPVGVATVLGFFGFVGGSSGISSVTKITNVYRCFIQGIRQSAEYDTKELKRLLENKLNMLR